jgi:hypothetical protein
MKQVFNSKLFFIHRVIILQNTLALLKCVCVLTVFTFRLTRLGIKYREIQERNFIRHYSVLQHLSERNLH